MRGALPVPFAVVADDLDELAPVGAQLLEVSALVLLALAPDQLRLRVLDVRLVDLAERGLAARAASGARRRGRP